MPAGYQGYSPTDWARAAATTLAHHITTLEVATTRNFPALSQIEASGRISYNHSGRGFDWPVQYRIHNVEGNTGETQRNFVRRNLFKTAALEYRGYQTTDAMYHAEFVQNKGPEGIVKVFDNFVDRLRMSLRQVLGKEIYSNGNASGNEKFWHGMETLFGTNGTVKVDTGAQRASNQADKNGYPSSTYATLSTELGAAGGEWESGSVWPEGDGDPEYDYWSPMIVVSNSSVFQDILEAFRYGILHCQKNATLEEQMTTAVLSRDMFFTALNKLDDKEEIQIQPGGDYSLRSLGFKNTFGYDGVEFTFDSAISGTKGYGYNYMNCELRAQDDSLLRPEGPEYDIETQSYQAVISTLSNKKYSSPRNFIKWVPHTAIV
jgi:hypothetical protein